MLSGRRKSRSPYHRNSEQKKKSTHQHRSSRNPHNRNETSCRRGIPLAWQRAVLYSGSAIFHPARSQERGEYPCGQKTIALSVEDGLLTPYLRRGGNHDGRLHQRKQKKKKKKLYANTQAVQTPQRRAIQSISQRDPRYARRTINWQRKILLKPKPRNPRLEVRQVKILAAKTHTLSVEEGRP